MAGDQEDPAAQQRAALAEARRKRILERGKDRFSQITATYNAPAPVAPAALLGADSVQLAGSASAGTLPDPAANAANVAASATALAPMTLATTAATTTVSATTGAVIQQLHGNIQLAHHQGTPPKPGPHQLGSQSSERIAPVPTPPEPTPTTSDLMPALSELRAATATHITEVQNAPSGSASASETCGAPAPTPVADTAANRARSNLGSAPGPAATGTAASGTAGAERAAAIGNLNDVAHTATRGMGSRAEVSAFDEDPFPPSGLSVSSAAVSAGLQVGVRAWQRAVRQTEAMRVLAAVLLAVLHSSPGWSGWLPAFPPLLTLWATQVSLVVPLTLFLVAVPSIQVLGNSQATDGAQPLMGLLNIIPGGKPLAQVAGCMGSLLVGLADSAAVFLVTVVLVKCWHGVHVPNDQDAIN